jgi:hypothetical protein
MKTLRWIAWIMTGIAGILILLALISLVTGATILGINHAVNIFHTASSILLLAIALFIGTKQCCCDCGDCKDEKK